MKLFSSSLTEEPSDLFAPRRTKLTQKQGLPRMNKNTALLATLLALVVTGCSTGNPLKRVVNPTQYGYSQAAVASADATLVFASGQVGQDAEGPNDFESQVDRSFDALAATLEAAGATTDQVVKITLLIVDHDAEKLAYLVKKRRSFFGDTPPASTLIPVPVLYAPGVLFEIDAIAVTP